MSDKKQTVDLGLLEEDDEFEEFPAEGKSCIYYIWVFIFLVRVYCRFVAAGPHSSDSASLATLASASFLRKYSTAHIDSLKWLFPN